MKLRHPVRWIPAAAATLLVAVFAAGASANQDAAKAASSGAHWPMFRGNPALTGVASGTLPDKLSLLWSFKTGGPVKSSAAIVGGRFFIGSGDSHGYALELASGKKTWAAKTGGPVDSSPLVLEGKVFFGSTDASLYAVEAASGRQLWKYETGDKILGAPNWVKSPMGDANWVLVGSYDFKLHCVEAATGRTNWVYETGNYINGSPAGFEGKTAFGGCDAILHVISLAKGEKGKEIEAGADIARSAAVADNRAYFGHYENEFLCIDIGEEKRAWTFKDRDFPYFSSPAVTKDLVVFGGRDKRLHCVQRDTGESVWTL